jgi:hypothetical protein
MVASVVDGAPPPPAIQALLNAVGTGHPLHRARRLAQLRLTL